MKNFYLIRSNTLRNNAKDDFNKRIEAEYKALYGDDWRKGAEKAGMVNHKDGAQLAKRKRKEIERKREENFKESVLDSVKELADKRKISGVQAQRIDNTISRM